MGLGFDVHVCPKCRRGNAPVRATAGIDWGSRHESTWFLECGCQLNEAEMDRATKPQFVRWYPEEPDSDPHERELRDSPTPQEGPSGI